MADKFKSAAHRASLEACWKVDLDWNLYPKKLVDVSIYDIRKSSIVVRAWLDP